MLNEFRKQRNDKNKKRSTYIKRDLGYETRRTGRNLIRKIKDNPVEAVALGAGGLLAARYGYKGLVNALNTKAVGAGLGKMSVIKSKAFIKGAAQGVKQDLNRVDKIKNSFKRTP